MSDSAKTLVIISPGFPKDETDSTCLPAQQIFVKSLNKVYPLLDIVILALQYPGSKTEYRWNNNLVVPFNSKAYGRLLRPLLWNKVYRRIQKVTRANPVIGILSLWCSETALIGNYFARRHNVRHFCWILGQDARKGNKFIRWINPNGHTLIAMSDFLALEFFRNHGIKPSWIIPNGIDPSLFDNLVGPTARDIDILGVGSLIPLKQYHVLIKAVARLRIHHLGIRAVLCGAGPLENELKKLSDSLGVGQNVTFSGAVSHRDVLRLMRRSKILVHPSAYEGYCTVCLEALYAGCHVVSFTYPERKKINRWHMVASPEDLITLCRELLDTETDYPSVLVHSMEDAGRTLIQMFQPEKAS